MLKSKRQVGTFFLLDGDSLLLKIASDESRTAKIPMARVTGVERSAGRHGHFWSGAALGFLAGAAVGGAIGVASGQGDPEYGYLHLGVGIIGGAVLGFLVGGAAGAAIKTERWEPL